MNEYLVEWSIDIGADSPVKAVLAASGVIRDALDGNCDALVFEVTDENGDVTRVDLSGGGG